LRRIIVIDWLLLILFAAEVDFDTTGHRFD